MMYDDGSYDVVGSDGTIYAVDTEGNAVSSVTADGRYYAADNSEAAKMDQFYPKNGATWYENLAKYGATRAIDAHFSKPAVNKTATGATFAGQNGRTYSGGAFRTPIEGDGVMLIVLAAVAFFALS